MKIDIISDVHLTCFKDFGDNFIYAWIPKGNVLILAGDVGEAHWWQMKARLIDVLCEKYQHVLYIAGNHDYYGITIQEGDIRFREIENRRPDFHFLEQNVLEIDGIKFAGCSLWFKWDEMNQFYERYLSDFSHIQQFNPAVYDRNRESQEFLRNLQDIDVVITHHMPTYFSVNERYTGDPCNRFFLCEMDDVILNLQPRIWIHGHTHIPVDYRLGRTRIIANPMGYVGENRFGKEGYGPVTIEL